jgi:hypothetical protein
MSLGNPGQSPVVMRFAAVNAHLPERRRDHLDVVGPGARHLDVAAGNRRHHTPAPRFDVVAREMMLRPAARRRGLDPDRRRALALDAHSHRTKKPAELHDVGLHGGVPDLRPATSAGGSKECRLGARHRRFVEIERRADQPARRVERVPGLVERHRAQRAERLQVRGDRPPRREVPSGG